MKRLILTLTLISLSTVAGADVQLKIKDRNGSVSTISSNGKQARIDGGLQPGYMIIDYSTGTFYMVDSVRQQVMTSSLGQGGAAATTGAGVQVAMQAAGNGPSIAGYSTRKFTFTANGQSCGTIYASSSLLQNQGVRAMFESMRTMQQQARGMMGNFGSLMSDCDRASLQMADAMEAAGAPLRILDEKGRLESEVLSVDTGASLAGNFYQVPPGMKVVDLEQQMGEAMQNSEQMMQQMPNMDELMQQIGGLQADPLSHGS